MPKMHRILVSLIRGGNYENPTHPSPSCNYFNVEIISTPLLKAPQMPYCVHLHPPVQGEKKTHVEIQEIIIFAAL
jgi:hypothetical protein